MKKIYRITTIILCSILAGCLFPSKDVSKPKSGKGFGMVTYEYGTFDKSRRFELHYWDGKGRNFVIWKECWFQWVIRDDIAMFHGLLYKGPLSASTQQSDCLFAVAGNGPPVDITDSIILRYTRPIGTNISTEIYHHAIGSVQYTNNTFVIGISDLRTHTDGAVKLTDAEILNLVREAKEKGQLLKDRGWGTPYFKRDLQEEF